MLEPEKPLIIGLQVSVASINVQFVVQSNEREMVFNKCRNLPAPLRNGPWKQIQCELLKFIETRLRKNQSEMVIIIIRCVEK